MRCDDMKNLKTKDKEESFHGNDSILVFLFFVCTAFLALSGLGRLMHRPTRACAGSGSGTYRPGMALHRL